MHDGHVHVQARCRLADKEERAALEASLVASREEVAESKEALRAMEARIENANADAAARIAKGEAQAAGAPPAGGGGGSVCMKDIMSGGGGGAALGRARGPAAHATDHRPRRAAWRVGESGLSGWRPGLIYGPKADLV